ncbi:histidine kinase [Demequina sp.]|uniref:sensor histidine kinase n=1 Tax=Demequina sp. TaxID=2050685 RepID=UPI0025C731B9|nr:histidine kinase [Demequina sp.]
MTETGPFTELNSRRLGPVRRFFVTRPRAMDAVVVALVVVVVGTSDVGTGASRSVAVGMGFAVAAATALVWRRPRPVVVTSVVVSVGVLSLALTGSLGGLELALAFALYAVATSRRAGTAWLTAAVSFAVLVTAVWVWEQESADVMVRGDDGTYMVTDDRVGTTAQVLIFTLAAMAIGNSVRSRREHLADLMERANALAKDRDRQAQLARAAERSRIAREMHDVVAHSLSVMITLADGASVALDRAPERSRAALTELTSTGRAALRDMRRVLGALADDDAPLEPTGQGDDLVGLIDRFRTAGLPVRAEGLRLEPPADTGLRLALYRVVQESLTNVLRHAPGTAGVAVELHHHPNHWEVTISDQGGVVPAPESDGAGLGLVGMRERVELFGGTVDAGPWEHGWRVHVTIPHQEAHT